MIESIPEYPKWNEKNLKLETERSNSKMREVEKKISLFLRRKRFLRLFGKMFSFARRGVATNLRLYSKGAALCTDLEAGIIN